MRLSERAQAIKPSPTLAIDARAKALKASGEDIINFGVGEPDFDTPENIKDAQINSSMDISAYLLDQAKVAVVPGKAFGDDRYIRLSYATSMDNIKKGLDRIENALAKIK